MSDWLTRIEKGLEFMSLMNSHKNDLETMTCVLREFISIVQSATTFIYADSSQIVLARCAKQIVNLSDEAKELLKG